MHLSQVVINSMNDEQPDPAEPRQRHLVLVGLMGAGKSCIGRRLAARLGWRFLDADNEIEKAAGCTIPDIFERHGETAFRDGERRVIQRLLAAEQPHVIATGGGAYMDPATRGAIGARGIAIWLKADLDVLVRRTSRRDNRPLLRQGDPRDILEGLMERRHPVYALADLTVDSQDGPPEATVERVLQALRAAGHAVENEEEGEALERS